MAWVCAFVSMVLGRTSQLEALLTLLFFFGRLTSHIIDIFILPDGWKIGALRICVYRKIDVYIAKLIYSFLNISYYEKVILFDVHASCWKC